MIYLMAMLMAEARMSNNAEATTQEQTAVSRAAQTAAAGKGVMLFEDFEGSWPPPGWEVETTNTHSTGGQPCYWYKGDGGGGTRWQNNGTWFASVWWDYPDLQDELLISPPIDLPTGLTGAAIQFEQYVYHGLGTENYWLIISDDNFATYGVLDMFEDYPTELDSTTIWTYDLSPYIGRVIRLAWWYWAPDSSSRGVWFVDNVQIDTTGSAVAENLDTKASNLRVSPNPSHGLVSFAIGPDTQGQVAIYDAAGRLVVSRNFKTSMKLRLEPGVYFYRVKTEQHEYQGNLVVN